jgi:hypothetical protein
VREEIRFITDDGVVFENRQDAEKHESKLIQQQQVYKDLEDWWGSAIDCVDATDMARWLVDKYELIPKEKT